MIILQIAGLIVAVALLLVPIAWVIGRVLDYRRPLKISGKDGLRYEPTPLVKRKVKK